ncbi:dihydrodipicolinate synthase family protein [Phyllobacterium zundukense]|uniref:Dihydrodipicolinate synthase family protein n=2 Tax=Phyllobacterium zundukense TaxID=1867719 RepID=A0A2N9VPT2_9HYPH|nr:dihydrodipicolinate synthase family protein [Phyllobacterium zundukense]ATU95022.1 dihydrodipicolinate synthase family protein [Phyllobacterium zundukense]PIO41500.1 dihydrodipicolinate synthase family protein [Phyllobacterium zundukense]
MRIDVPKAVNHAQHCLQSGCTSVTLFGTTGEGSSIGNDEREIVFNAFLSAGIEPAQIVIGVMANSYLDAAAQARVALHAGCRGVLLAPPSYFKNVSDDGLFVWFSSVFAEIGTSARSVILYNIPSVTAVEISVALVSRLREAFPNVVAGVKDSSGNWSYTETLLARHKDLAILIGDERDLAAGVRLGGQGAISGMANLYADRLLPMINEGREDPTMIEAVNELLKFPVTPAVKAMVAHHSGDDGWRRARAPLQALSDSDFKRLTGIFDRLFVAAAA